MATTANDTAPMQKEVATSADCEIEETFANSLIKHRLCLVALPQTSVDILKACAQQITPESDDNANLLLNQKVGQNTFLEFGIKDSSGTDPFTLGFRQLDRVAREAFSAICRSKVVGVDPGLANALLDCYPLSPGVTTSSTLEVIQTGAATDSSVICGEHEDLGVITLIWTAQPGLHVYSPADKKWLEVPSGPDHVAVLPGRTLHYITAGQVTCPMYRLVGGSPLVVAFMLRANEDSLLDCSALLHKSKRPVPDSFAKRLTVQQLAATVTPAVVEPAPAVVAKPQEVAPKPKAIAPPVVKRDDTVKYDQAVKPVEPADIHAPAANGSWQAGLPSQKFYACVPCANPEIIRTKSMTMSQSFNLRHWASNKSKKEQAPAPAVQPEIQYAPIVDRPQRLAKGDSRRMLFKWPSKEQPSGPVSSSGQGSKRIAWKWPSLKRVQA